MSVHCDLVILRGITSCHPLICTVEVSPHNTGHQDCSVEEWCPCFEVCVPVKFAVVLGIDFGGEDVDDCLVCVGRVFVVEAHACRLLVRCVGKG